MTNQLPHSFKTVHRLADIPFFQSEQEEHEFWATHEFGEELLSAAQPLARGILPPPRKRTKNVAVRLLP